MGQSQERKTNCCWAPSRPPLNRRDVLSSRTGSVLPLWGTSGASECSHHPSCKDTISVPRESQLSELCTVFFFNLFSLGSPSKHFPFCSQTRHAAAPCMHRQKCLSQAVSKWLCWSGDKEFHFTGKRPASKGSFFRKFRAVIGLRHGSPYSATCFLHSILLSSALQMWV